MMNTAIKMPYPGKEEPRHNFTSKISSPTKRTLNNKNFLAENPPAYSYTATLEQDFTEKLQFSNVPQQTEKDNQRLPLVEASSHYFMHNYKTGYKGAPVFPIPQQQQNRNSLAANRTSPTKNSKTTNGKPKIARCKEKKDASTVPSLNKAQKQKIMANRYFAPPVDLHKCRKPDGKLKPIIDVPYNMAKNSANHRNYRLANPLMLCEDKFRVVAQEIEMIYREKYREAQPLCMSGDSDHTYRSLQEMTAGLTEYLRNAKMPAGRSLIAGPSWNESFELSFDGKAIDRSDIFRMVDSFSVALSDDEQEDSARENLPPRNVLPPEMTSSAF